MKLAHQEGVQDLTLTFIISKKYCDDLVSRNAFLFLIKKRKWRMLAHFLFFICIFREKYCFFP